MQLPSDSLTILYDFHLANDRPHAHTPETRVYCVCVCYQEASALISSAALWWRRKWRRGDVWGKITVFQWNMELSSQYKQSHMLAVRSEAGSSWGSSCQPTGVQLKLLWTNDGRVWADHRGEELTLVHHNPCTARRDSTCDSHMYNALLGQWESGKDAAALKNRQCVLNAHTCAPTPRDTPCFGRHETNCSLCWRPWSHEKSELA